MKKNMVLMALCLFGFSQSSYATKLQIKNMTEKPEAEFIDVNPVWTGRNPQFSRLAKEAFEEYSTGLHRLRRIQWKMPSGWCWDADIEEYCKFKGILTPIIIKIYDSSKFTLTIDGQESTHFAKKGNC